MCVLCVRLTSEMRWKKSSDHRILVINERVTVINRVVANEYYVSAMKELQRINKRKEKDPERHQTTARQP